MTGFLQRSEIYEEYGFIAAGQARICFNEFVKKSETQESFLFSDRKYIIHDVEIKENQFPPIVKVHYVIYGMVR